LQNWHHMCGYHRGGTQGMLNVYRLVTLVLGIPLGALGYCTVLIGIWHVMGRPSGIEEEITQRMFKRQ
jgi:hypothetical protein